MPDVADFVVQSPDDKVQLVVEAKTKPDASALWAAHMRRNLIAHAAVPSTPYFILALPDHFYMWKNAQSAGTVTPDYVIDTREVLRPYLESLKSSVRDLSEQSFELVVRTWLEDLVKADLGPGREGPQQKWLLDSGLYERVRDGTVKTRS